MKLALKTWGNSLAIRIPAQLTKELGVVDGSIVEAHEESGKLILTPIREKPKYTLSELLEGLTPENQHAEIQTGPAVGKEVC